MNLPKEIEEFVNNLVPTDVGVDTVGDYVVHYEGFSDECNDGHDDNSIDEVYAEVFQDFDDRQGEEALIRGVANDSLGCENNPVLYSVYGELQEAKLNLKLIDNEISEARLYRTSSGFGQLTGQQISELLYLNTLITYLLYKSDKQSDYAVAVAKQSTQYGKYTLFRSHATDLYMLAYMVSDPDNRNIKLKNHLQSKNFLKKLQFDKRRHWQFLQSIGFRRATDRVASPYLFRLESQLKIKNSMYKQWRRLTMDWENLKYTQRQYLITKLTQEIRKLGRGSEVMAPLTTMLKYRRYRVNKDIAKPTLGRKIAGAAAGAVIGRVAGKKIAKRFGKDQDKYKKYGTGLGAIAGYWAGGRQRQK